MLPLCCAEMITSSGPAIDSTTRATSTYLASPRAALKVSRLTACATPSPPTIATTATKTRRRQADGEERYTIASIDAAPMAVIGHVGSRKRRYHHAFHGT